MKDFEELCHIVERITANPKEKVDYLTVRDFLQLRQHVLICKPCSDKVDGVVELHCRKTVNINFGGASEN